MSRELSGQAKHIARRGVSTCGSKGGGSAYDPQVGQAAQQNSDLAKQSLDWTQHYYDTVITPALQQQQKDTAQTTANENQLFQLNYGQAEQARDTYNKYGLPATTSYYDMVNNYSAPEFANQQAEQALGDNKTAQAATHTTYEQRLGAAGIDPSSPAAIAAEGDMATGNAANNAAAMTRARLNAQQLGIQLKSDAVNVANGGASQVINSGNAASGNTQAASGASGAYTGATNASSGTVLGGYGVAANAYGNNLNAYSRLGAADIQASASNDASLGQFLGTAAGIAQKAGMFSDRRLKRALRKLGTLANGVDVYEFKYKWGGLGEVGVMAQDVASIVPDAVANDSGFYTVNYAMLR